MQLGKTVRNKPQIKNAPKCRINVEQNTKNKNCLIHVRLVRFAAKLCLKVEKWNRSISRFIVILMSFRLNFKKKWRSIALHFTKFKQVCNTQIQVFNMLQTFSVHHRAISLRHWTWDFINFLGSLSSWRCRVGAVQLSCRPGCLSPWTMGIHRDSAQLLKAGMQEQRAESNVSFTAECQLCQNWFKRMWWEPVLCKGLTLAQSCSDLFLLWASGPSTCIQAEVYFLVNV